MNDVLPGRERILAAFTHAQKTQTAALMPYFTLGYPDRATSLAVIEAIAPFCDLMELGVPFSDPLADGPTVQRSTQRALEQGVTVADCLAMVGELRGRGVDTPVMLMGYYNPILAYGEGRFVREAVEAGVDGFIVPDLSVEEAGSLEALVNAADLALVHFVAPTSNPERVKLISGRARGFLYLVSLTGVTGVRSQLATGLAEFVESVRAHTDVPLAVGFGISTPELAGQVGGIADGVIVGSALINAVDGAEDKPAGAEAFVRALREGLLR